MIWFRLVGVFLIVVYFILAVNYLKKSDEFKEIKKKENLNGKKTKKK